MGIRLKPLRKLLKTCYCKYIPLAVWTPDLISLFEELKGTIIPSSLLARFDPEKTPFLKTDWSAEGMGWVLIQSVNDVESTKATKNY